MELITQLNAHIKKTSAPEIKLLHDKCDKLMQVVAKLNDRLSRIEQFKADTPVSKITADTTPIRPTKWIRRIDTEVEDDFKVRDITPKECIKIIIPKNTDKLNVYFESVSIKRQNYILFKKVDEKCTIDVSQLTRDHYLWSINGDKVNNSSFQEAARKVSNNLANGCALYFKRLSSAQKRARDADEELKLQGLREKLWNQYLVFFSGKFRDKNVNKHHRYRPGCGSCSNKRAVEQLRQIISNRVKDINEYAELSHTSDKLYDHVEGMETQEYDDMLNDIEEPITPRPLKKQKTLRELYVAAGNPELTYDIIRQSMTEEQIREAYNL